MCEFSNVAAQTINPGEAMLFSTVEVPCNRGLVRHREGSGIFMLSGQVPQNYGCGCRNKYAYYLVDFGANIAIPDGETVGPISVAIAIDGTTIPASIMTVTPAAVEQYFNISRAITADIFKGCCEALSIRNISNIPILASNANIIISRPDLYISR